MARYRYPDTVGYRAANDALRRELGAVLGQEFLHLRLADLDASWPGYARMATQTVGASSSLHSLEALDYFRQWLISEVGEAMAGDILAQTVRVDLTDVAYRLKVKGPIEVKRLIAAGWDPQEAYLSAMRQTVNVMQGYAHNVGQQSLNQAMAIHSDVLQGWHRIVSPTACAFCRKLTGTVWRPSAQWEKPHDKCSCTAEPVPNSARINPVVTPRMQWQNQRTGEVISLAKRGMHARLAAPLAA